ncbi:LysM peptidoglycan-binding domain-containing protein [Oscillospiraceae bacterium 44-34]
MRKLKKAFSLTLALALSLTMAVPAFAAESKWNVEVSGKSNAQVFVGEKSFTLRDCGRYDYDYITKDEVFYKEDDLQWTAKNVCVLEKGDTAVFTYTYRPQESTGQGAFSGGGISSISFQMIAWSDPDGDGVYDARLIKERDQDNYDYEEDGYCDLLPENWYEVLPTGFDLKNNPTVAWQYQSSWSELVGIDEKLNYEEVRLSADRVLELFGPNTLVGIYDGGIFTSDPADMDWFILVEGTISQPTEPTTPTEPQQPVTPDAPGSYTVKKGDSWSSICTNFYGTNAQRYELMKANKNTALKEGTVITLPEKLGKAILLPAPAAAEGEKLYTVKAGDTLGKIAAAEYGRAGEYKAIFERNADRLKNANTIYEGQVIVLPARK